MNKFTVKETNICKGVACMLLLLHHLFYNHTRWDKFYHLFGITPPLISRIAVIAKVCVAIFVILSGYGLTKSFEKYGKNKLGMKFVYRHLCRLMLIYWFIFIVFVPLGFVLGRNPIDIYGTGAKGFVKFIIDLLGLANLINTPTMNPTWWYMGVAILLYFSFPLLYKATVKFPYVVLILSATICFFGIGARFFHSILAWIFPFVTGIYLANSGLLERIINIKNQTYVKTISVVGILIVVLLRSIFDLSIKVDTFLGLAIIIFTVLVLSRIQYINRALELIGKHSANIFMFHTFIFLYYFHNAIYSLWYPILIYPVLLIVCLLLSVALEKIKTLIRYNEMQKWIVKEGG